MAKHLLLNWLVENLGAYVDNLTTDNLKMGVLDGVLEFHNLHLKPMALAKLNLPFIVHSFSKIKYLKIVIPWTNLGGGIPVQLLIDGIYVQINPLDYSSLSKEEIDTRGNEVRKDILRQATSLAMESGLSSLFETAIGKSADNMGVDDTGGRRASLATSASSSSFSSSSGTSKLQNTYMQRLFAKIIANIEVNIRNLHFRYEDSRTIDSKAISAGITLDELQIISTDENWRVLVSSGELSESGRTNTPKYKLANLRNLTAYWNTDATPLDVPKSTLAQSYHLRENTWEQIMAGYIYKEVIGDKQGVGVLEEIRYVLCAPNRLSVMLTDRSNMKQILHREPQIDTVVDTNTDLLLALDSKQLLQLCLVLDNFAGTARSKFLKLFRPLERPTKDPRAWWVYAYRLVTGRDDIISAGRLSAATIKLCLSARERYIALSKKSLDKNTDLQHASFLACMTDLNVPMHAINAHNATLSEQFKHLTSSSGSSSLSSSEQAEFLRFEAILPLSALVVFRQLAVRELIETARTKGAKIIEISKKKEQRMEILEAVKPKTKLTTKMKNLFRYGSTNAPQEEVQPNSYCTSGAESSVEDPHKKVKSLFGKLFGNGGKSKRENQSDSSAVVAICSITPNFSESPALNSIDGDIAIEMLDFTDALWSEAEEEDAAAAAEGGDLLLVRASIIMTAKVKLTVENRPLMDAALAIGLQFSMRSASDMNIRFVINEMFLQDRITPTPIRPYLLTYIKASEPSLQSETLKGSEKAVGELDISKTLGKSTFRITALPLELVWNAQCITGIVDMFATPFSVLSPWPKVPMASYHLLSHRDSHSPSVESLDAHSLPLPTLFVNVDMEAPKIIIPVNSSVDGCGFVVLDMGSLALNASLENELSWTVNLSEFCATISTNSSGIYTAGQVPGYHHLINPLRISVSSETNPLSTPNDPQGMLISIVPHSRMHVKFNSETLGIFVEILNRLVLDIEYMKSICKRADSRKARRDSDFLQESLGRDEDASLQSKATLLSMYADLLGEHPLRDTLEKELQIAMNHLFEPLLARSLDATIKIPLSELLIDVLYEERWDSYYLNERNRMLSILLPRIHCHIDLYPKDLSVHLTVGGIFISDSMRPQLQQYLLKTSASDEPAASVQINEIRCFTSPIFKGQGLEVVVDVHRINLSLDASAILHAHSVAQVLVSKLTKVFAQKHRTIMAKAQHTNAVPQSPETQHHMGAMSADLVSRSRDDSFHSNDSIQHSPFDRIKDLSSKSESTQPCSSILSLEGSPIRPREHASNRRSSIVVGMARRHCIFSRLSGRVKKQESELEYKLINIKLECLTIDVFKSAEGQEEGPDSPLLDSVCSLRLEQLSGCIKNRHQTSAQLSVAAIDITDERKIATHFSIRKMLRCRVSEPEGACLTVIYTETGQSKSVDICMVNILSTFALDSVADTANVAINIAFAILTVITLPDAEAVFIKDDGDSLMPYSNQTQDRFNDDLSETISECGSDEYGTDIIVEDIVPDVNDPLLRTDSLAQSGSSLHVHVRLHNPIVVLIDDPLVDLTRSVLATCEVSVHCSIENWASALQQKQESLHASVCDIEIYALPDTRAYLDAREVQGEIEQPQPADRRCVCAKFGAEFQATRKLEQDIVLAANIALEITDINAVVSLENIHLFDSILSRRTLTGLAPSKQIRNTTYCIFGARDGKAGKQVDIYVISLKLGTIVITAINDLGTSTTSGSARQNISGLTGDWASNISTLPALLRVQFSNASFQGDGALHPRLLVDNTAVKLEIDTHHWHGTGLLMANLEYFNSHVGLWEPVVELWRPELLIVKRHRGMMIEITAPLTLQVNISGRMIDSLVKAYSLLLQREENFRMMERSISHGQNDDLNSPEPFSRSHTTSMAIRSVESGQQHYVGPGIVITNGLLCNIEYRVVQAVLDLKSQGSKEWMNSCIRESIVQPGLADTVSIDPRRKGTSLELRIQSLHYRWSKCIDVSTLMDTVHIIDIPSESDFHPPHTLKLHTSTTMSSAPILEITVFIDAALIDRTGLKLSVRANRKRTAIVRKSFGIERGRCQLVEKLLTLGRERQIRRYHMHERQDADDEAEIAESKEDFKAAAGTVDPSSPSLIDDLCFASRRPYCSVRRCTTTQQVYTDRDLQWGHLPPIFHEQLYISTACDDYAAKNTSLITFTTRSEVLVFILIDAGSVQNNRAPRWMVSQGYRRIIDTSVARGRNSSNSMMAEHHYLAWGKRFSCGSSVSLGSAEACGGFGMHYCAFVVDPESLNVHTDGILDTIDQVCSDSELAAVGNQWIVGENGLCYFHTDNDRIALGIGGLKSRDSLHWSDDVSLSTLNSKSSIDVKDKNSKKSFLLSYNVSSLPGLFNRTRVVTVTPYYCIVNCMDEPVELRQKDAQTDEVVFVDPFHSCAWHKTNYDAGTKIHIRLQSSLWSYGCVDINEIGSSVLLLPSVSWFHASSNHDAVVAHVEVKLAEPTDNCVVVVVIWRSCRERGSMLSIKNDSDLPITIQQAGVFGNETVSLGSSVVNSLPILRRKQQDQQQQEALGTAAESLSPIDKADVAPKVSDEDKFSVCVAPGIWQPFGWADPEGPPVVTITVGTPPHGPVKICATLGLLRLNVVTKLMTSEADPRKLYNKAGEAHSPACVYIAVQALGSGRVIRVVKTEKELSLAVRITTEDDMMGHGTGTISKTATGAIVGGVMVGSLIIGPIAGALLAGAGIYAVSRTVQKRRAEKRRAEKKRMLFLEAKASSQIPSNSDAEPQTTEGSSAETAGPEKVPDRDSETPVEDLTKITANYSAALYFKFAAISISLTVEKPFRRELMSLFVESIEGSMKVTATARSFELTIKDIQLDTYSETALHPVILHTLRNEDSCHAPLLHLIVIEEAHPETATQHYKYIAMRLLELSVSLDSATLQLLLIDLGADLSLVSRDQALAISKPAAWVREFTSQMLTSEHRVQLVDIYRSQSTAQAEKVYIENLVLHPIKLTVSFTQTTLPRGKKEASVALAVAMLSYIPAFATVDSVALKLNSFIAADVMESGQSLVTRIFAQAYRDLRYQLARLAGSLTMLGRPVGLARNVGGGVQAFFYEPYQGAMKSPSQLVLGVGKGTGALFSGFVTGALNSTASIVSTATAGISQGACYISPDDNFAQKRADVRTRAQQAAKEGIIAGLMEGGYSATSGFASGIGGLLFTPLEHASRGGPRGLVTGLGMGIVGVPIRAVLGLTDALNSVAQTVIVQTSDHHRRALLRPSRAYRCLQFPAVTSESDIEVALKSESANIAALASSISSDSNKVDQWSDDNTDSTRSSDMLPLRAEVDATITMKAAIKTASGIGLARDAASSVATAAKIAVAIGAMNMNELVTSSNGPKLTWMQENLRLLVLIPLDLAAAYAQAYVVGFAKQRGISDAFLGYALLTRDPKKVNNTDSGAMYLGEAVFATLRGLIWRNITTENSAAVDMIMDAPPPSSDSPPKSSELNSFEQVHMPPVLHIANSADEYDEVKSDAVSKPSSESFGLHSNLVSKIGADASENPRALSNLGGTVRSLGVPPTPGLSAAVPPRSTVPADVKVKRREEVWFFQWGDVSHSRIAQTPPNSVEIMTSTQVVTIRCLNRQRMLELYAMLLVNSPRMAHPEYMLDIDESLRGIDDGDADSAILGDAERQERERADALYYGADKYRFGSANYHHNYYRAPVDSDKASIIAQAKREVDDLVQRMTAAFPQKGKHGDTTSRKQCKENEAESKLLESDPSLKWRNVDNIMYHLVSDWHAMSSAGATSRGTRSRCVCCTVINGSRFPVQIMRTELEYGEGLYVIGGFGYSKEARTLLPGGCVIIFLTADRPTLFGSGHAKATISSAAFSATLSTRRVTIDSVLTPRGVLSVPPHGSEVRPFVTSRSSGGCLNENSDYVPLINRERSGAWDRVRVLEKTQSDSWVKTVIFISKCSFDQ